MKQKVLDFLNALQGMRKFLAWFGLFFVAIIFLVKGMINGAEFVDLMKNTFMGFVAGNGVEYLANTVKTHLELKGQKTDDIPMAVEADDSEDKEKADGSKN